MNQADLPSFHADDPESVVDAFIRAMNPWETYANRVSRDRGVDAWPEILRSQAVVFYAFCTRKDRKHGRNGSFQRPPEYDHDQEKIAAVEPVSEKRAHVETVRESLLAEGRYRYVLLRQKERWLIDSVQFFDGNGWQRSIL